MSDRLMNVIKRSAHQASRDLTRRSSLSAHSLSYGPRTCSLEGGREGGGRGAGVELQSLPVCYSVTQSGPSL